MLAQCGVRWAVSMALLTSGSAWSFSLHTTSRGTLPRVAPFAPAASNRELLSCSGRATEKHCRCDAKMSENMAETKLQPVEEELQDVSEALQQTLYTVLGASAFCGGVLALRGTQDASAWLAAYVLEESLSVDNLFVFTLIFDYFKTPTSAQPRVLRWGFIVAVVLRASFIFAGLAVVERFKGMLLLFSGVLLYSAYGILSGGEDEDEEDLSQNAVVQFTQKYLPFPTTTEYEGSQFFLTPKDGGEALATPLLLALVCVEISDVLFAVDSVPAVFGVTQDPFIALTSNAFALLGLRSLYTIIAQGIDQFHYLQTSIALVLGFIGVKLVGSYFDFEIDTIVSLALVLATLGAGIGFSLLFPKPDDDTAEDSQ